MISNIIWTLSPFLSSEVFWFPPCPDASRGWSLGYRVRCGSSLGCPRCLPAWRREMKAQRWVTESAPVLYNDDGRMLTSTMNMSSADLSKYMRRSPLVHTQVLLLRTQSLLTVQNDEHVRIRPGSKHVTREGGDLIGNDCRTKTQTHLFTQ